MVYIILEYVDHGKILCDFDSIPETNNPQGKTVKELIQDDIQAGTNKTGHAKYRKILEREKVLNNAEVQEWRQKLPMNEKDLPDPTLIF